MIKIFEIIKRPLRRLRHSMRAMLYYGNERYCPVCEKSSRKFLPFGVTVQRKDAQCTHCGSLERYRFLWIYLLKKTNIFNAETKRMLHVAPESCLESRFKRHLGDGYLTADLFNPEAMVKMDITNIDYADESFDIIYCSHVLEHVVDDRKAMREFFRVLKSDGWAILLVPIGREKTFEDSSIVDPQDRLKYFGQDDHVRIYGLDYIDRLRESGFDVKVTKVSDLVEENEAERMGMTSFSGDIYYCTKPTKNRP